MIGCFIFLYTRGPIILAKLSSRSYSCALLPICSFLLTEIVLIPVYLLYSSKCFFGGVLILLSSFRIIELERKELVIFY